MSTPLRVLYQSSTLVDVLTDYSVSLAEKVCVTVSNDSIETKFTFKRLHDRALNRAQWISEKSKVGDRVILALPTSPEFIEYFFACILSGRIAVPLPVEKANGRFSRIDGVIGDCQPTLIVFRNREDYEKMKDGIKGQEILIAQELPDTPTRRTDSTIKISPNHVALIQYTSGSTSTPKGVVLTHTNVISNLRMIQQAMQITPDERVVSWLPLHHDMGLIGNLLSFVCAGASTFLYPYQEFARNPMSWIEAMSTQGATLSGAPTFAFDLIGKRLAKSGDSKYDLSNIRLLYCGSERISAEVTDRFFRALSPAALNPETFFPCYGMAEASLFISGTLQNANRITTSQIEGRYYPSCGFVANGLCLRVTEGEITLPPGEVGEIQIQGPSVSVGYWKEIAHEVVESEYLGNAHSRWLKTGDLGCVIDNQVVITGRLKDLIKVRGRNIYPDDVELEVERLEEWFAPNAVVAIASTTSDSSQECLTIVAEILRTRRADPFEGLLSEVQAILSNQELRCDRLVIVSPGAMPKTSSGKKQRSRTAEMLDTGKLKALWDSRATFVHGVSRSPERESKLDSIIEDLQQLTNTINFTLADERRTFPAGFVSDLRRAKLLGLLVPKQFGGLELTASEFSVVGEALGSADLSLGAMVGNHNTIGVLPILWSSTLRDRESVLEEIAKGGEVASFAITEPSAGSNPRGIQSVAQNDGEKLLLSGEKIWIGNAQIAKFICVFAKEMDAQGAEIGISAFLVRRGSHSFEVCDEQLTVGLRAMAQNRLIFNNVELSEADRLSPPGMGLTLAFRCMEYARFGLASLAIGALKSCVAKSTEYANTRAVWTGLLSENAHYKEQLKDVNLKIQALQALVEHTGNTLDLKGELPPILSLSCKILAGEWSSECIDRCLQSTGGRGYTETFGLARYWRDARVIRIFEGPTETVAFQLGSLLMRQPDALENSLGGRTNGISLSLTLNNFINTHTARVDAESLSIHLGVFAAKALALELYRRHHPITREQQELVTELINVLELELGQTLRKAELLQKLATPIADRLTPVVRATQKGTMYDSWPSVSNVLAPAFSGKSSPTHPRETPKERFAEAVIPTPKTDTKIAPSHESLEDIRLRLQSWLKTHTRVASVDNNKSIVEYGVDSLLGYELLCFAEEEFGAKLPESIVAQKPSLNELSNLILSKSKEPKSVTSASKNVG